MDPGRAINQVGSGTTATYPEQTFTFTGGNGDVYGYHVTRANNMLNVQGVEDFASVGIGTTVTKGDNINPTIGVIGNSYLTINNASNVDDITLGMAFGGNGWSLATILRLLVSTEHSRSSILTKRLLITSRLQPTLLLSSPSLRLLQPTMV